MKSEAKVPFQFFNPFIGVRTFQTDLLYDKIRSIIGKPKYINPNAKIERPIVCQYSTTLSEQDEEEMLEKYEIPLIKESKTDLQYRISEFKDENPSKKFKKDENTDADAAKHIDVPPKEDKENTVSSGTVAETTDQTIALNKFNKEKVEKGRIILLPTRYSARLKKAGRKSFAHFR